MKTHYALTATVIKTFTAVFFLASCTLPPPAAPTAERIDVRGLRSNQLTEQDLIPAMTEYVGKTPGEQDKIARSFEQQPPLIPHKIDGYRIDFKTNRCMECHDRSFYKEEKAPKIGDSHYLDGDGKALQQLSMARYSCTQCHVPQANAQPLIGNTFQPIKAMN